VRNVLPRSVVASSVRNVYGHPERVTDDLIDRYMAMTSRAGNRQALAQRMAQLSLGDSAGVGRLRLQTLVIWGGRDQLIPVANARRFGQDIQGSTVVVFDDLGHVPQEEDPQRTVAAVKRFLGMPG
jgi:pimeloyl-ACP methyl ester carboxylesterase